MFNFDESFDFVHYSFKYTNSNNNPGGIKLSKEDYLDLPYVAGRVLIKDGIEIDYATNPGKAQRFLKENNIYNVPEIKKLEDKLKKLKKANDKDKDKEIANIELEIKQKHDELRLDEKIKDFEDSIPHTEFKCDDLGGKSIRLKQVFLLTKNKDYLAATPLSALGINKIAIEKVQQLRNIKDNNLRLPKQVSFGGANTQNIGGLAHIGIRRAFVFSAPKEDKEIRQAIYILQYEKIQVPEKALKSLKETIDVQRQRYESGTNYTSSGNRDKIKSRFNYLVNSILKSWNIKSEKIQCVGFTDKDIDEKDFLKRGLLFPNFRDNKWKEMLADKIVKEISNYKDSRGEHISIDANTLEHIKSFILKEVL